MAAVTPGGDAATDVPGVVAAFDFDGTLTRTDTLWPFLRRLCGARAVFDAGRHESRGIAAVAWGRGDRDGLKAAMIGRLLTGHPAADARQLGIRFGETVVSARLRRGALELLHWHRRRGHRTILVSAGLDLYLSRVGELLGFDHVIATRLEECEGRLTGRLLGANVRGAEKARLLGELLADQRVRLFAYGNGPGDREMLAMADRPLLVRRWGRLPLPIDD